MNTNNMIKKAKIVIVCGQSNASGVSRNWCLERTVGKERAEKLKAGFPNIKIAYHCGGLGPSTVPFRQEPDRGSANVCETFTGLTWDCGSHKCKEFFGPELGIGEYLSEKYPGETFYIVKHSYGGSTIGDYLPENPLADFLSPDEPEKRDVLALDSYGELRELFDKAVGELTASEEITPEVVAVCWMQGESEGGLGERFSATYKARQEKLIANFRKDYKEFAPEKGIAFIDAAINGNGTWRDHEIINRGKFEIAESDDNNYFIDTNKAGLTCDFEPEGNPDIYHYDSASGLLLGNLYGVKISEVLEK